MANREYFICDVDGVLLDIVTPAVEIINRKFNSDLTVEDITTWDWEYALSFPPQYWKEFWNELWSVDCDPYDGANDFLDALRDLGYTPVGISTRPGIWKGCKPGNKARTSGVRDNKKLHLENTTFVNCHSDKLDVVRELYSPHGSPRFAIEDNPKNATQLAQVVEESFVFSRPWNSGCVSITDSWSFVESYSDILEIVSGKSS